MPKKKSPKKSPDPKPRGLFLNLPPKDRAALEKRAEANFRSVQQQVQFELSQRSRPARPAAPKPEGPSES